MRRGQVQKNGAFTLSRFSATADRLLCRILEAASSLRDNSILSMCFSPDGRLLATNGSDSVIRVGGNNGCIGFESRAHHVNRLCCRCGVLKHVKYCTLAMGTRVILGPWIFRTMASCLYAGVEMDRCIFGSRARWDRGAEQ